MPDASTTAQPAPAAQAPAAGGAPASPAAVTDAPPTIAPAGPNLNVSTVSADGGIAMPPIVAKTVQVAGELPVHNDGSEAEFVILHHRVGTDPQCRRGALVHRRRFGPHADIDFMLSKGAIAQINREPEKVADPLPPPATTDPVKGLPPGGVKGK